MFILFLDPLKTLNNWAMGMQGKNLLWASLRYYPLSLLHSYIIYHKEMDRIPTKLKVGYIFHQQKYGKGALASIGFVDEEIRLRNKN